MWPSAPDEACRFIGRKKTTGTNPQLRVRRLLAAASRGEVRYRSTVLPRSARDLTVTPEQLIQILATLKIDEHAREAMLAQNVVPIHVSDLDGTLWMEPVADALVYDRLAASGELKPVIRDPLSTLMREMGLAPSGLDQSDRGVNRDVLRVKQAFDRRKGGYGAEKLAYWSRRIYPLTSWALAGFTADEVRRLTREVIAENGLENGAFAGAKEQILALQKAGLDTVLFSASNDILAQEAVDVIFGREPRLEVIGTHVRADAAGVLTTEVVGGACFREAKLAKVKGFLRSYVAEKFPDWTARLDLDALRPLLASGDSPSKTDEQMMEDAVIACAVEPATTRDVKSAIRMAKTNGRTFILDYASTVGGDPADKYRVDRPMGGAVGAL